MVLGVLTDVAKIRFCVDFSERERDRQTDRQTDRDRDRQRDRDRDGQTQTDRDRETETERGGGILNVADGENKDA